MFIEIFTLTEVDDRFYKLLLNNNIAINKQTNWTINSLFERVN